MSPVSTKEFDMKMGWIEEAIQEEEAKKETLSFKDYMELFHECSDKQLRPSYEYILNMLEFYGKDEKGVFKLFQMNHDDAPPVYGHKQAQLQLFQNLQNFREEGFNNKFLLLVGPNGSAKSSLVRKLMKGAEEYSQTDDGALYTFSWIFPIDTVVRGSLGLGMNHTTSHQDLNSYAYLDDKDINAILASELKDHPILLIPIKFRQKLIEDKLAGNPALLDSVKKSYIYKGDLSKRNRMVYDALLKNYKGNHADVLKHIRVERFFVSKRYSTGAVTIEPQLHVDARAQQITMDRRLASLPPSLQSLNLFMLQGEAVMANRGILEFSDLLKRPLDTYKYLLQTMETSTVNLQGILTDLDIFFIGTSNEIHLAAFKQHPDFNSFKGRFNFVRVPYLLDYQMEERIYLDQISGLRDRTIFEPNALRTICLFSVMSRLRCPESKNYQDKALAKIISEINPLQKALILCFEQVLPDGLDTEAKQVLKQGLEELEHEFELESLYEGKFGISPRDVKKIIYELTQSHSNITFVDVLEYLKKFIVKKNEYDFLNMTPQGDYHHPARFISLIQSYCLDIFDRELRDCLGLVDNRSYEEYIRKYISNINALIKGEKIKNEITGQFVPCDEYFVKEFEKNIELKEDSKKFRSYLIAKLGAYSLDNPGKQITYTNVFPDLVSLLKESFRNDQKQLIQTISKNIVFYEAEQTGKKEAKMGSPLSEKDRQLITNIVKNLVSNFSYTETGALALIKHLIKERY